MNQDTFFWDILSLRPGGEYASFTFKLHVQQLAKVTLKQQSTVAKNKYELRRKWGEKKEKKNSETVREQQEKKTQPLFIMPNKTRLLLLYTRQVSQKRKGTPELNSMSWLTTAVLVHYLMSSPADFSTCSLSSIRKVSACYLLTSLHSKAIFYICTFH